MSSVIYVTLLANVTTEKQNITVQVNYIHLILSCQRKGTKK